MGMLDDYTGEEIENTIALSKNFAEVLIKLGISANSPSNRMLISQYAKDHNIDISHFEASRVNLSAMDIFVEHSCASQSTMRRYYKAGNYSEYKCAVCGMEPFWNGMPLSFTLDHINGVSDDHRLENLRWVCPNCDRQLPTYGNKSEEYEYQHTCDGCWKEIRGNKSGLCKECYTKKRYEQSKKNKLNKPKVKREKRPSQTKSCPNCGVPIHLDSKLCQTCFKISERRVGRPSPIELAKLIVEHGFENVGKMFGVSGKAISKWCKAYNMPTHKKEVEKWYAEQICEEYCDNNRTRRNINEIVRPVNQIDLKTGKIINTFASKNEAARHVGAHDGTYIGKVCNGKAKTAHGYGWKYAA